MASFLKLTEVRGTLLVVNVDAINCYYTEGYHTVITLRGDGILNVSETAEYIDNRIRRLGPESFL